MNKGRYHKILRYDSQLKFRDANYLKCIFICYHYVFLLHILWVGFLLTIITSCEA